MTLCRFSLTVLAALIASAALLTEPPANSQEVAAPAAPPAVEVLARGPIHEAYAESAGGDPKESPIIVKEPPAPIDELPPDQKPDGDNVQWMPGYWAFDDAKQDFLWISGFWRSPPPNRRWVPGHWKDTNGGWQWIPGFWGAAEEDEVAYLPPPPAPVQMAPTPPPSADQVYVPGCWVWRDDHYAWRPGYYIPCRPDWIWVPAHYVWTPCGHVFVDGYWDYTLKDRGILFSPVAIDRSAIQVGFVYTPAYAVHHETLCGAMFVRPGCRCYFYGDYFDNSYSSAGYVSWCSVSVGYSDPMFAYYRVQNRSDPQWEIQLNLTFTGRYNGSIPRPPVTVVQNNTTIVNNTTIINNTTINNTTINNTTVTNNRFVAAGAGPMPLSQMASKGIKLSPVTPQERQAHVAVARQIVQASHARAQTEAKVLAQGPPPTKPTDKPRTAKLDLPKAPPASARAAAMPPAHSDTKPAASSVAHPTAPTPAPNHPATPAAAHGPAPAPAPGHPTTPTTPAAAHAPAPAPAPGHPTTPTTPAAAHAPAPAPAPGHPTTPTTPAAAHAPAPAPAPGHPTTPTTPAAHAPAPAPGHPAAPGTPAAHAPAPAPGHPAPPGTPAAPAPGQPAAPGTPAALAPAPAPGQPAAPATPSAPAGQAKQPPSAPGQ